MSSTDDTPWQKAKASNSGGGCLEFRRHQGTAQLRDSKRGDESPILSFNRMELSSFLDGARNGEFDHLLNGLE